MSTTILVSPEQCKQQATPSIDLSEIFKCISDDKSLILFNSVAHMNEKSELLISKLDMTRKQFYARMERLTRQGLIMRKGGQYHLATLGKIIYHFQKVRQQR
jgi:predicted transcriptional regulator